ncbi:alpha/beta hydrolase [Jeongeupia naejangsanensis]|uniref:Alpha/beta hydrolase n=1 Tax=Jeongeupia naejangsanensis TaxID=613195 RepID=A0ABS2BL94_9NEIS|nr:alpha/beta hydrolase [Jeongeupia naejangsanensis]MBM3116215.1 alpha/beta hydrolase [Jeongeupia naejangsanensis]
MATQLRVVLVHGAWADGSSWSKVIPLLEAEGFEVTAAQLPLSSLADDAAVTRNLLSMRDVPTVLVGHSYGGAVISEAASNIGNVVALVYIAAFAPDTGESLGGIFSRQAAPAGAQSIRPQPNGLLWIDPALFRESFAQDCSEADARLMAAVQKPIAGRCFEDTVTVPAWKTIPSWYQISENDHMIPPEAQRWMAERMKATTISLPASHASLVSSPIEITRLIADAAASS